MLRVTAIIVGWVRRVFCAVTHRCLHASRDGGLRRKRLTHPTGFLILFCCGFYPSTHAADWKPEKPVEIVVNTPPGNGPDRTARLMQSILQDKKQIEVPVAVSNKLGGGGVVAYTYLNSRPADGHTLMIASKALLTNHIAGRGPSYTEFTPIAHLFGEYLVVTVKPDSPLKSGRDLIESVKKNPAGYSFGIATSLGNPNHQALAVALKAGGLDIKSLKNVVFNAGSAALAALMGGHVDVVPVTAALGSQLVAQGQVRALAVSAPKRLGGVLAEVPTIHESGLAGFDEGGQHGVIAPAGVPKPVLDKLHAAIVTAMRSTEVTKRLSDDGSEAVASTPDEYRALIRRETAKWRKVVPAAGIARQ